MPSVGKDTRLPFLTGPFAIIGDEQSIEASLSTFGAQAKTLADIMTYADDTDLVLIDEIGSATDPVEGGALAAASLEALRDQVRLTIATTHLGDLKGLAEESDHTVNASLEFDGERLAPTYRLRKHRPGRSYALEIAARLGVPDAVLDSARHRLDDNHRALDALLARLEDEQLELAKQKEELRVARERAGRTESEQAAREVELKRRAAELERASADAVETALRASRQEVEDAIERLEAAYAGLRDGRALREARRETRDVIERGLREAKRDRAKRQRASRQPGDSGELTVGERVAWRVGGRVGTLIELRGGRAVIDADGLRLTVSADELESAPDAPASTAARRKDGSLRERRERQPGFDVETEIDLRGLRVEEVDGRPDPRVGRGRGLRAPVAEDHPRERDWRRAQSRPRTTRDGHPDLRVSARGSSRRGKRRDDREIHMTYRPVCDPPVRTGATSIGTRRVIDRRPANTTWLARRSGRGCSW